MGRKNPFGDGTAMGRRVSSRNWIISFCTRGSITRTTWIESSLSMRLELQVARYNLDVGSGTRLVAKKQENYSVL
jgi:hypothetical protein